MDRRKVILPNLCAYVWIQGQIELWSEDEAMGGAAKVEHANLVAFIDMAVNFGREVHAGNLCHSDENHTHEIDCGIVSLDPDNTSCGNGRNVALGVCVCSRVGGTASLNDLVDTFIRIETVKDRLGVVGTWHQLIVDDCAADRSVPAVV